MDELDQVYAELAGTRDDFDARREVLDKAAHMLLHKSALGGQVIARICATLEDDRVLEDALDLTSAALAAARMSYESGQGRGAALITAMEDALELAAGQNRLDMFHRLALARAWAQNALEPPDALELSATADEMHDAPPPANFASLDAMLDDLYRDLVKQADGDPFTLHTVLSETFPAMPPPLREAVVEASIWRDDPLYARLGCYWLVDRSANLRSAAARGLAARRKAGRLEADIVARLSVLRSWMPPDDARAQVDQILRDALRNGLGAPQRAQLWSAQNAHASLPDGSGAQSMAIALQSSKARALGMILLKSDHGVKDAYVISCKSARDQASLIDRMTEETGAISVPLSYVASSVTLALGDGLAQGLPPAPGLIDVAERAGLQGLRPEPSDTQTLLRKLSVYSQIQAASAQKRGRLINASSDWWDRHELLRYWHEESDDARHAIAQARSPSARERALWRWLETRRGWWAHQIARSAALLDAAGHPDAASFAATALALLDGRDLKKIPIMEDILEQSFEAWAFETNEAGEDDAPMEFISVAQDDAPMAERKGEFAALLKEAKVTTDWIDGYLMAVIIAPKIITPSRWMPPLFDRVLNGMGPLELQRFLDVVMMRANGAIAAADAPKDFEDQMTQRGLKGQSDWAAGFTLGCEKFKSSWPAKSTGPNDRAIQRQISDGSKAGLCAGEIRIIAEWLGSRHAANTTEA